MTAGLWTTSRGSGGFKATHESIAVRKDEEDDSYYVKMFTPIGSHLLEDEIPSLDAAVEIAEDIAREKGFPVDDE